MWFSLADQTAYFLWSIVLGAAAAVLYDLIRAVRIFFGAGKIHVLIGDILFFILCGIFTSLFALPFNKGSVRAFIVFGEAVGFLCYRLTIGTVAGRFYSILSKTVAHVLNKICELLKKFFDLLLKITSCVVYNVGVLKGRIQYIASEKRKKCRRRKVRKNNRPYVRKSERKRSGREKQKRNRNERRYKEKNKGRCKGAKG